MQKTIRKLSKVEKIAAVFLSLAILFTGFKISYAFYLEHSEITPVNGGVFIEGAVGKVELLNPLFVHQGTISHDLTQLIFSGLTKYDPETRDILPDIANYKISSNGKEYTFVIKEKAFWHDGNPVTADDVLFTYNSVIKNPEFKGAILNYNDYTGIKVTKIDNRTVQFLLEKPDSFFLVKTMTGLLPKHLLENNPIEFIDSSPFNFMPVGSGKYKFISQNIFTDHTEISLEAFKDFYDGPPHIDNIMIKVFVDFKDLIKALSELDGVRNIPDEYKERVLSRNFKLEHYQLPQYVAIFINNEVPKLRGSKVRLALQLGTDKESIIKEISQQKTIDTPFLELDQENWMHQYSVSKANGALFDTQWKIPENMPIEGPMQEGEIDEEAGENSEVSTLSTPEKDPNDTSEVTYINSPNEGKDWQTTQKRITITGTAPKNTKAIMVNDYELKKYAPGDPGWSYVASLEFDNLKEGGNIYKIYAIDFNGEKELIDAITITYGSEVVFTEEKKRLLVEENISAPDLLTRRSKDGEELILNLITSQNPPIYGEIAKILKKQWRKIGVDLNIEILDNETFYNRLNKREYDLLIFGQNLGYNLDAYPYWHSSQAKEGGLNLSQFKNFVVDSLLEKARYEREEEDRLKTLRDIQYVISQEAPAVFLYSPTYYLALSSKVQNASFKNLATISDRFANIETWYAKVDRKLKKGTNPLTFFIWITKQF